MEISELARNRAEEYGKDLWTEFVIPPYYSKMELLQSEKPSVIEGGRGSGKTMLLRYLCHDTQFSINRKNRIEEDINRIGIYWKMDTQFAKIMDKRGEVSDIWIHAFINMGVLILSREILGSLANIHDSTFNDKNNNFLQLLDFSDLQSFDENIPSDFDTIRSFFHSRYNQFQVWVSNYKKIEQPLFYPIDLIKDLINLIKSQVPILKNTTYHVYIDEYENLLDQQKKIINTWLKHSQSPLIFNIAMKHNAFNMRETLGEEKIVAIHDYRMFDIENLLDNNFKTFAYEILLLKLKKSGFDNIPIEESKLFDSSNNVIELRKSNEYRASVETKIKELFPGHTNKELSVLMLQDTVIRGKIEELIKSAFKLKGLENAISLDDNYPEAMIVLPALLSRTTITINDVITELSLYKEGNKSEFKNWISNNLVGCILHIYGKLNRICPFYAGYEAFVTMSKDNIRHFLELCYTSLAQVDTLSPIISIPQKQQAAAVKQVSSNMLKEIKSLGIQGNALYAFALRLGTVFEEGRKKITQSEPEQTQFNIKDTPSPKTLSFINELVKWSVLYETKLTKQKDLESGVEYQLNPIYSSYFTISYRKKRRISLTNSDFEIIAFGEAADFEYFLKNKYSKTQDSYIQNSLFDDEL